MTSAHRLEGNSNYAYSGYLAGVELSHLLGNQSCTQFKVFTIYSLPISGMSYFCLMIWSYIDLGVGWADLAGALGCGCCLVALL
jgi:hypothetical protein